MKSATGSMYDHRKDKKGGKHKLGKLTRMTIRPAENGVMIEHEHEPHQTEKSNEPMAGHYEPPKPFVFGSHKEAAAHVAHHLAHHAAGHMMHSDGTYAEDLPAEHEPEEEEEEGEV